MKRLKRISYRKLLWGTHPSGVKPEEPARPAAARKPRSETRLERPPASPSALLRARPRSRRSSRWLRPRHSARHWRPRRTSRLGPTEGKLRASLRHHPPPLPHLLPLRGRSCWREWVPSPANGSPSPWPARPRFNPWAAMVSPRGRPRGSGAWESLRAGCGRGTRGVEGWGRTGAWLRRGARHGRDHRRALVARLSSAARALGVPRCAAFSLFSTLGGREDGREP